MAKVLIIRLSAIGDVAMCIPVCYSLAKQYPQDEFIFLTRKKMFPLFLNSPHNLRCVEFDTVDKHKGIKGIWRLFRSLRCLGITQVADLHQVLRSVLLATFFRFSFIPIATLNKGRKEKQQLVSQKNKKRVPLLHTIERYKVVFQTLGYTIDLDFSSLFKSKEKQPERYGISVDQQNKPWIAVAPFAQHKGKIYPLEKMKKVVQLLASYSYTLFLFGGGQKEKAILDKWASEYFNVHSVVGQYPLDEELVLINQMDVMIAMDSANMHFASLVEVPVVSIWGATHPDAGFYGYHQSLEHFVSIDLACRPCSIFGNKPCLSKGYACLNKIEPMHVVRTCQKVLQEKGLC